MEVELRNLKVSELRNICKDKGYRGYYKLRKDELIKLIIEKHLFAELQFEDDIFEKPRPQRPKRVPKINYFYKIKDDIFNKPKPQKPETLNQIFPFSEKLFKEEEKPVKNTEEKQLFSI